jgi:D-Tyr-tRNAtyr deacylase
LCDPNPGEFCAARERTGFTVARGAFGARVLVEIANDGPVTIVIDA